MINKRITFFLIALSISTTVLGQKTYFSGYAGKSEDYIYADFLDDNGTRCIISDVLTFSWPCSGAFSLLKFIPPSDSQETVHYALAIETQDFLPKNAKLVFICSQGNDSGVVTIKQAGYIDTFGVETKNSLSLTPFAVLGGGLRLSMLLSNKTSLAEVQAYYGVYEISRHGIDYILKSDKFECRIPTRSKYVAFTGTHDSRDGFIAWLESALSHVDERSLQSVNTIEDNIVISQ